MEITLDQLISIAQEIETEDPIDWGMLNISEENAYRLIAASVLENHSQQVENRELILLATVVKLTVENFVLNLKLLNNQK